MKVKILISAIALSVSSFVMAHGNLAEVVAKGEREHALEMIQDGSNVNAFFSEGTTALIYAAHKGDLELAEALIAAGADVNHQNEYGAYALSEAAISRSSELIKLLLENGADANQSNPEGETPLMVTARNGNLLGVAHLLKHGADVNLKEGWGGQSALMWATAQKQPEMMALLISNGAEVNTHGAIRIWDRRITSEPRPKDMNKGGFYPIHYAARQGCAECVDVLVNAGADLNVTDPDRVTPLSLALINQQFDTAAVLIEAGADVNKWDIFGRSPLFNAVDLNSLPTGGRKDIPSDDALQGVDIARMLLERNANPNMQLSLRPPYRDVPNDRGGDSVLSTGATPLLMAARTADVESTSLLLEYGALPNLPNSNGQTPIMVVSGIDYPSNPTRGRYKTEGASIEVIGLLLSAGADINAISGDPTKRPGFSTDKPVFNRFNAVSGRSALHAAAGQGWNEIIQYLIDSGAQQQQKDARGMTPIDMAMGRFEVNSLETSPEANPVTVKLLQDSCVADEACDLDAM